MVDFSAMPIVRNVANQANEPSPPHCTTILFIDHNYDGRGIYDNDLWEVLGQKRKVPILAISYMLNTGTKDSVSDGGEAKVELGHRMVSACVYN